MNMQRLYPYTLITDKEPWDFSRFTPDVVCIALGVNDVGTSPYDTRLLAQACCDFYEELRRLYPQATLVWLSGGPLTGQRAKDLRNAIDIMEQQAADNDDYFVYSFDLMPLDGSQKFGADWHPGRMHHIQMANELTDFLRIIMDWYNEDEEREFY